MAPLSSFETMNLSRLSTLARRSSSILRSRAPAPDDKYDPGHGQVSPFDINNTVMFVFFGILSAALVCASIWFFFWAKNGGFRFRKRDWDDYKTTVLRRKGPNGTLLSGATPSTALGGGSIVGSQGSMSEFADPEKGAMAAEGKKNKKNRFRRHKNGRDDDVRAYRHEKVAKVGGLNRQADGSYYDHTNSDRSELRSEMSEVNSARPYERNSGIRGGGGHQSSKRVPKGRDFSYTAGTEATFTVASDDSHRPLTQASPQSNASPSHYNPRHSANPRHSRQQSPSERASGYKPAQSRYSGRHSSYTEPLDFESRYDGSSQAGTEQERNTKAYHHPIPGLSKGPSAMTGFRRGGGGRRDSLSDSDGETYRS